jgi:uncharacterized protein YbdZ (MbtH family)
MVALVLALSTSQGASAQSAFRTSSFALDADTTPFGISDTGEYVNPSLVDIDGDGDLDMFVGENAGKARYFQNTGTPLVPVFTIDSDTTPFGFADIGAQHAPTFADLDGDGDFDAMVGESDGTLNYYENTGTPLAPAFTRLNDSSPFGIEDKGGSSKPSFVDIDSDGDFDLFVGYQDGLTRFFENTGTSVAPAYTFNSDTTPFDISDVGNSSGPTFADMDGDGDMDAFVGENTVSINYFENTGTPLVPVFTLDADTTPFGLSIPSARAMPLFADIDGDGDLDAFVGDFPGKVRYFSNTGTGPLNGYTLDADTTPFDLSDQGSNAITRFVDLDGDGDLDAFGGEATGNLNYFPNTGTALVPVFGTVVNSDPFGITDVGTDSAPAFADIDGDGDLDAFVGEDSGSMNYFQNTGTILAPAFAAAVTSNPFGLTDVGTESVPAFVDIDGDGDLDAFIGETSGNLNYFPNSGTPLVPVFSLDSDTTPFGISDIGSNSTPDFVDLDGDGDFDLLLGESTGQINYFENTGTVLAPAFTLDSDTTPLNLPDTQTRSAPAFADIDGDGDPDVFNGTVGGLHYYSENTRRVDGTFTASIPTPEGWHFIANPISGQTFNDYLGGVWTQGFTGADVTVGDVTVLSYDETNTNVSSAVGFSAISSQSTAMTPGQGFIAYIFEDNDLTTSTVDGGFPKSISLTGQESASPFTFSLSLTATKGPQDANNDGWNLLGNPFGSTVDWDVGFTLSNVDGTVYVWDPSTSAYKTWNGTTGDLTDGLIAPLQGFFAHANAASPTMSAALTSKANGGTFLKGGPRPALLDLMLADDAGTSRPAFLMFSPSGLPGADPLDGFVLTPLGASWLSFFSLADPAAPMSINHLPIPRKAPTEIPLGLIAFRDGQAVGGSFTLSWPRFQDIPDDWRLELHDGQTGEIVDLRTASEYRFEYSATSQKRQQAPDALAQSTPVLKAASAGERFTLVISSSVSTSIGAGFELPAETSLDQNYPNPFSRATTLRYAMPEPGRVMLAVYDLQGREVARLVDTLHQAGWYDIAWDASALPSGVYFARLQAGGVSLSRTLTLIR